jgi:MYXO-CTERM domain-containing protein
VRWLIVAQPHDVGTKTATFSVDHPGGTASVMLIANGIDDVATGDEGGVRDSYYACSTGSPSSAWPLLLVFVPLLRRRRR